MVLMENIELAFPNTDEAIVWPMGQKIELLNDLYSPPPPKESNSGVKYSSLRSEPERLP